MKAHTSAFTVFVLVGLGPVLAVPLHAQAASGCPDKVKPQSHKKPFATAGRGKGKLIPVGPAGTPLGPDATVMSMDFGGTRGPKVRARTFRLPRGAKASSVRIGPINDIADEDSNEVLPLAANQVTYRAVPHPANPRFVNVRVCYDTSGPTEPEPGDYKGSLIVVASGAPPASLALDVTLREDSSWKPILALIVGLLFGVLARAIADLQQAPATTDRKLIGHYLWSWRTLVTAGFGVAAGAIAYIQLFEDNATFSGDFASLWPLVGVTFGATVAGKTLADLKGPSDKERDVGLAPKAT